MSPLTLRRYRAERLLQSEFEALQARVTATVARRLRSSGVSLDDGDLQAAYAQAWQGLYVAVLEGEQIANPAGWLVLVAFRRALDEHRARARAQRVCTAAGGGSGLDGDAPAARERDLAAELDDRARLRHLFEGLRGRLSEREREAAVLCYLQGLPRSQAAARMGISEARMRKLMEGHGPGRPGVAGKVGALVASIRDGEWCEEQGSLMRALAFGILDPDGERHSLALMHSGDCPACRRYVASLRGLAAALPPVFLPWGLGAGALSQIAEGAHTGAVAAGSAGGGASGGVAQLGQGVSPTIAASGTAGVGGAAGGGWLLAGGPLGAKLAVGCLLALGVGAGCVALDTGREHRPHQAHTGAHAHGVARGGSSQSTSLTPGVIGRAAILAPRSGAGSSVAPLAAAAKASREFGPESALSGAGARLAASSARVPRSTARSASSSSSSARVAGGSAAGAGTTEVSPATQASATPAPASQAEREFAPG